MRYYSGTLFYDNASDLIGGCDVVFTGFGVSFLLFAYLYNSLSFWVSRTSRKQSTDPNIP